MLGIIKNEKYIGDILMGKTFTVDPITKRRLANFGESDKYHIENHHEPIISKEDFENAQEIRLRRAQNRNTIANKDRKREKLSRQYAFSSMLECGFCGEILSRRTWHTSSIYKKINWQCVRSTKKGKKYCPHSKGIQEAAIEKSFVESYRQLCHADSTVIDDFLKIVEEEINDETLVKDLKKLENQLIGYIWYEAPFNLMYSSGMGSIQAAIKKLLNCGYIKYEEAIENGRYKKIIQ